MRNKITWNPLATLLMLGLLLGPALVQARSLPDFTELAEQNSPAVVNISTHQRSGVHGALPKGFSIPDLPDDHPLNELFRRFFDGQKDQPEDDEQTLSLGSGFIISEDGYVLTNYHVVKDSDEVIVRLSNRKSYEAKVVGSDKASDVALLKIDATGLPTVKIGSASKLKVGEWVLAIGSPFGFDHTVTAGIVSAKGRSLPSENYVPFIQTDVAINPGNSGGPLFDMNGEVVGINSQIYSRTGGFMGLSFAIPIELAMNVADQLRTSGHVSRGYLGVLIQDVDRNLAESFGLDHPRGALVAKVIPDSPAQAAGIQTGDIILEFNGRKLLNSSELPPLVGPSTVGEEAELRILRGGRKLNLSMRVGELPAEGKAPAAMPAKAEEEKTDVIGLAVVDLTAEQRQQLELPKGQGVLVKSVRSGPAKQAGIHTGDVILMLDGRKVGDAKQFSAQLEKLPRGHSVAVLVQRRDGPIFLALRLPEQD